MSGFPIVSARLTVKRTWVQNGLVGQVSMPKHNVVTMVMYVTILNLMPFSVLKYVYPGKLQPWFLVIMEFVHDAAFFLSVMCKPHSD